MNYSFRDFNINEFCNKNRESKYKLINPKKENLRRKDLKELTRVTLQEKLILGCCDIILLESGTDNTSEEDTTTDMKKMGIKVNRVQQRIKLVICIERKGNGQG